MIRVLYIISCIFDAFVIYLLYDSFFAKRSEKYPIILVYIALALQQIITTLVSNSTESLNIRIITQLFCAFLVTFFFESIILKRIIVTVVFFVFAMISEAFAEGTIILMGITKGQEEEVFLLFLVEIFMLLLVLLTKLFKRNEGNMPKRYQVGYLLVPFFSIIVVYGMRNNKPTISWMISLMCLLLLNMVCYYLLNTLTGYIMQENQKKQMEQQIENQKEKYEQLSNSFIQGNRLLHDVNKHHRILKEYLLSRESEKAIQYIEKIDDSFCRIYSSVNTGNLVIDSILSNFKARLEQANCLSTIDVDIDKNQRIMDDYDLVVVLGNITDNILEAISQMDETVEKEVKIRIEMTKAACIFYSRNSVGKKETKKKKAIWYHGFGLNNVRETLAKYGGSMAINDQNDFYETMIQIPLEGEKN